MAISTGTQPVTAASVVVPSDTVNLAIPARALYIGVAGDVKVLTTGGSTITFNEHPVGYMPVSVARIFATGTAATDILALN